MLEGINVSYLVSNYGYIAIFGFLAGGMIGLPLPDETIMVFTGYLVSVGSLEYVPTVIAALIGSLSGITLSFFVGKKIGYPLVGRYGGKIGLNRDKILKVEKWFNRFGKFALPIGYFVPGVRHVMAYFAGISRMRYRDFSTYAYSGGLVWVILFVSLGWILGESWDKFSQYLGHYWVLITMVLLALLGISYLFYRLNQDTIVRKLLKEDKLVKVKDNP